jgi:SAM-dependent methyltransferase
VKPFVLSVRCEAEHVDCLDLHACPACDCKFFPDFQYPEYATTLYGPSAIKFYVEAGAGIDQLVAPLFAVPTAPGSHYLDIGCGYGFAVDFARHVFDLHALGVDPSQFAAAGRDGLKIKIIQTYLSPSLDLGGRLFDLVVASEVIEHTKDPLEFVELIKARLDDNGTLILTTPDADSVSPETCTTTMTSLLSPKLHYVLFSRKCLEQMLRKAGFRRVDVVKRSDTLVAAASSGDKTIDLTAPIDRRLFLEYLKRRYASVEMDSWLAHGLSYRLLKELTNSAAYSEALQVFAELGESVTRVYGIDLQDPDLTAIDSCVESTFEAFAQRFPLNLAGIGYFRGIIALNHERRPELAMRHFRLASRYGDALREHLARIGCADIEMDHFAQQGRLLHLRALAYTAPADAAGEALALAGTIARTEPQQTLEAREGIAELFAHLVDLGALNAAEQLVPTVLKLLAHRHLSNRVRYASHRGLGLLSLNKMHAPRMAAGHFLLAERAGARWLKEESSAADARDVLWRTRYERMLALVVAADTRRALRVAQKFQVVNAERRIPEDVMRDAQAIIHRLHKEGTNHQ